MFNGGDIPHHIFIPIFYWEEYEKMNDFNNIIESNEMIDLLDDFLSDNNSMIKSSTASKLVIGGMIGTNLMNDALNSALAYYSLNDILFIQGCQDYIDLLNEKNCQVYNQYIYYAELFTEVMIDSIVQHDPFKPRILNPTNEYKKIINTQILQNYSVIIINDTHLIPDAYLDTICQNFIGKIICIVDPFDVYGESYSNVPTVVDSFNKITPVNALARETYGIETRIINKKAKGVISTAKLGIRSIGKIDNKQYITKDPEIIDMVRHKQLRVPIRKNHKVFVTGNALYESLNSNSVMKHNVVTKNSMVLVDTVQTKPLMKLRIYSSSRTFYGDLVYIDEPFVRHQCNILCKPANILSVDESVFHRYKHTVLVSTDGSHFTLRERYSILKNSMNITIVKM